MIRFLLILICITPSLFAQKSGIVIDATDQLPITNAIIHTGHQVELSDENGQFLINDSVVEITITHVGYLTQKVTINRNINVISVYLKPDIVSLPELNVGLDHIPDPLKSSTASNINIPVGDLDNIKASNLKILQAIPGVFIHTGTLNTNRITIRGIGSRTPYSTNRIKAYFADIPLTTGDGVSIIEDIDLTAISRFDILKGPSSALYGSGLGGVINIKPAISVDNHLNFSSSFGSFNTIKNSFTGGFSKNALNASLNYSNLTSNGYRANSEYNRHSLLFNSNYHKGKHHLSANILFTDLHAQIPSSLKLEDYQNNPEIAAPNWAAVKGFEDYSKWLGGISYNVYLSGNFHNKLTVFGGSSNQYESRPFDILSDRLNHYGLRNKLAFSKANFRLIAGLEFYNEHYQYSLYKTNVGRMGELKNKNSEQRQYTNVFSYYYYKPTKNLTFDIGVNLNFLNFKITDRFEADNSNISSQFSYDPILSPRIGVNYKFTKHVTLYSSIGHGFSHPSLEETLLPEGSINTELKPEQGIQFEIGTRIKLFSNKTLVDIALYNTELHNLLLTKRESEEIFYGANAGKTLHKGIEFNVRQVIIQQNAIKLLYKINGNYSENIFIDFIDNGENYSGNHLPGIPNYTINQALNLEMDDYLMANIAISSVGWQYLNDGNTKKENKYYHINADLSYMLYSGNWAKFFIFASANNILNRKFAGMILVNAPSFNGSVPRYYYPAEPTNFNIGINIKL